MAAALSPRTITNDSASSPGWSAARLVKPTPITFRSADGAFTLHAQLFTPPKPSGAGVVYTHGGSERQSFAAFHFGPVYAQQYAYNQYLAVERGLSVLSVNYRSGVGYGAAFRLCDLCMSFGSAEYADVRLAALVLSGRWPSQLHVAAEHSKAAAGGEAGGEAGGAAAAAYTPPPVDSKRIGIWGISYGGLNALQAVARDSHTVWAAAVSGAGIFNWLGSMRYVTDTGGQIYGIDVQPALPQYWRALQTGPLPHLAGPAWPAHVQERVLTSYLSSPAASVANMTAPLMIIQGDADQEVDFEESVGIVRAFRKAGLPPPEVLAVPDETHGLGAYRNWLHGYTAAADFFVRHL
jgi:dipeptidyl aminopeptidase/acylaminoacyl peptidase